jgi:quercetin dioxygenase-like cupin family protein
MRLERIPWPGPGTPVEAALCERLEAEGFSAFVWRDTPEATYSAHSHDHDESLWVVDGEITFGAEGKEFRLVAGDRLMLPKGTVHTARAGLRGATYLIGERTGRAPRRSP